MKDNEILGKKIANSENTVIKLKTTRIEEGNLF